MEDNIIGTKERYHYDGTVHVIGVNIIWKKADSARKYTTFSMCRTYREALEIFLKIKGGFDKIDIISIQDYDREKQKYVGEPLTADNENGIIYILKKEWKESN